MTCIKDSDQAIYMYAALPASYIYTLLKKRCSLNTFKGAHSHVPGESGWAGFGGTTSVADAGFCKGWFLVT